jgi:rhodanese-related sulfurtransferase
VQSIVPEICKSDLEQLLLADDASHELPFVLIDVREPSELVHGVIPGSHNIPLGELHAAFNLDDKSFLAKFKFSKPTMDARIVAYCRSGARSELATLMLIQGGWIHTRNYRGSFKEWFGRTYGM